MQKRNEPIRFLLRNVIVWQVRFVDPKTVRKLLVEHAKGTHLALDMVFVDNVINPACVRPRGISRRQHELPNIL